MKKFIVSFLKIIIPLGLGVFLIWLSVKDLKDQDKEAILNAFEEANYLWVFISLVLATLSHMSRAYRWKYTLEPLGYQPKFLNGFFAVMIGYLVNLAVPRLGEISRCGFLSRYEKVPFEKVLGTVIAERVADIIMLLAITTTVIFIQFEVIQELLNELLAKFIGNISTTTLIAILVGAGVAGIVTLIFIYRVKSENKIILTIQNLLKGVVEGVISIIKMKDKWAFIAHTLFIWLAYYLMFHICCYALPETSHLGIGALLTAFVLGSFAIALTQGGIGAYPIAIQSILILYGVDGNIGTAFGWIVWTGQTILVLGLGLLALWLMPIYNRKMKHVALSNAEG